MAPALVYHPRSSIKVGDEVRNRYWGPKFYRVTDVRSDAVVINVGDHEELTYGLVDGWVIKPKPKKKASTATQAYKGNGKHAWETVVAGTFRLRVPGGWLYRSSNDAGSMTFVPMPEVVKHAI